MKLLNAVVASLLISGIAQAVAAEKSNSLSQELTTVTLRFVDEIDIGDGHHIIGFYKSKEDQLNHKPVLEVFGEGYHSGEISSYRTHGQFKYRDSGSVVTISGGDFEVFKRAEAALKDQDLEMKLDGFGQVARDDDQKMHFVFKPRAATAQSTGMDKKYAEVLKQLAATQKQVELLSQQLKDAQAYSGSAAKQVAAPATAYNGPEEGSGARAGAAEPTSRKVP